VSRRRKKHPKPHTAPTLTASSEVFSEQELDFFRRGDELHPPSGDASEASESDA
jgi:hypothetical protein